MNQEPFGGAKWFVTFMGNSPNHDKYWLPGAADYDEARKEIFAKFGAKWAFMYPIEYLERQINEYNLTEL